jgi:hypothetical protein
MILKLLKCLYFANCSKEKFDAIINQSSVIVLGTFEGGFVFTTPKLAETLKYMVRAQGRLGGSFAADCTFNLTSGFLVLFHCFS